MHLKHQRLEYCYNCFYLKIAPSSKKHFRHENRMIRRLTATSNRLDFYILFKDSMTSDDLLICLFGTSKIYFCL